MRFIRLLYPLFVVLAAAPASAQDFGADWIERVTHELEQEEAPLKELPVAFHAYGGLLYYYDSNVLLHSTAEGDSVIVPWARGRLDYAALNFDAAADLMANYKLYASHGDASNDEERFFGRARYTGAAFSFELAEIVTRESDPTDVIFVDRVDRIVSTSYPRLHVDLTDTIGLEASASVQLVRFQAAQFKKIDNLNYRADMAAVYRLDGRYNASMQFGYLATDYAEATSVDFTGWYGRVGFRGAPLETLLLEATVGVSGVTSDPVPTNGGETISKVGLDTEIHARYEATQRLAITADHSRRFSFASGTDPVQTVDRFGASAEYAAQEETFLRARLQYELATPSIGNTRGFFSFSGSVEHHILPSVALDGGLTLRAGDSSSGSNFADFIAHLGIGLNY